MSARTVILSQAEAELAIAAKSVRRTVNMALEIAVLHQDTLKSSQTLNA
jgi:hypothetical protein